MPIYCYKCPNCGHRKQEIRTIADREPQRPRDWCLECAAPGDEVGIPRSVFVMRRDIEAETLGSTDLPYARPVFSESMGVSPDQVPECRQRFPDIQWQDNGTIRIDSHREYDRVRKALGYVDRSK